MLKWMTGKFNQKKEDVIPVSHHSGSNGWFPPQSADELLAVAGRKRLIQQLWESSPFSRSVWEAFWLTPVKELAVRIQQLPASQTGPYTKEGGMLDEALEVAVCAVKLSRGWMLPPDAAPEDQATQSAAWCTAIFWGALLHDVGVLNKMAAFHEDGSRWFPGVSAPVLPWRVRFIQGEGGSSLWCGLIAYRLIPEDGIRWLSRWPQIVNTLLIYLSGNKKEGTILHSAISEARQKCGMLSPELARSSAPSVVETASTILQNEPISSPEHVLTKPVSSPVVAISNSYTRSQHSDLTETPLTLRSAIDQDGLPVIVGSEPAIRQENGGNPEELLNILDQMTAGASVLEKVASETVQNPLTSSAATLSPGEGFWEWLIISVANGALTVNYQDSLLHVVKQFVFLQTPDCFYRYLSSQAQKDLTKDIIQKDFESLDRHFSRNGKGIYFYRKYENEKREGRYNKMSGYMIPLTLIFTNGASSPDSPWLSPNN